MAEKKELPITDMKQGGCGCGCGAATPKDAEAVKSGNNKPKK
jgi:hypothetical protein